MWDTIKANLWYRLKAHALHSRLSVFYAVAVYLKAHALHSRLSVLYAVAVYAPLSRRLAVGQARKTQSGPVTGRMAARGRVCAMGASVDGLIINARTLTAMHESLC